MTTKTEPLPLPNQEQLRAAHQVADDAGTVAATLPDADFWKREFPNEYHEEPDGKFRVSYRNPNNTVEQNERNSRKMMSLLREWRAAQSTVSAQRDAELDTVAVRGHDGVVMNVPAQMERRLAAKGKVVPVRRYGRATRYWWDKAGRCWKRPPGGDWEACEGGD